VVLKKVEEGKEERKRENETGKRKNFGRCVWEWKIVECRKIYSRSVQTGHICSVEYIGGYTLYSEVVLGSILWVLRAGYKLIWSQTPPPPRPHPKITFLCTGDDR